MEIVGSMPHSQGLFNNSYPESINPIPALIPISSRYILILSSHLRLGLHNGFFPVCLLKEFVLSSILATWPSHLKLLNHLDYIKWTVQTMKLLIKEPSSLPISSFLGPNNRLKILFSNTISLRSSLNVREHVSHPVVLLHLNNRRQRKSCYVTCL